MEATAVQSTLANLVVKEDEPGFYNREPIPMTIENQIPTAIGIWLLVIIAIIGNIMTIVAYITDKNLHNVYNYYIFHLAIADLLMAVSSMSVHSIYVLKGMMWPYGKTLCKIWLVNDFTLCMQTIFLMLILSVDRILLVSLGMKYTRVVTMKIAHITMVISWILSFLVYGPAIIWWDVWTGESWVPYDIECDIEHANDPLFTTVTAFFDCLLPLVGLSILNVILYAKIRKRNKVKPKGDRSTTIQSIAVSTAVTSANDCNKDGADQSQVDNKASQGKAIPARRDIKAFRFLVILVVVFLVCWLPYTVTTMVISFCEINCIDINLYELFIWFVWAKSAINPFLYAFNSQVYKNHFKRYIMFWKK